MKPIAIDVQNLTRRFGDFVAVNQVTFQIRYGEIFGFLGPNGAGKSTTVRMLCGILEPTEGTAKVAGFDVNTDSERVKESIGYVSQRFSLYTDLTVEENLAFYGRIYDLSKIILNQRIQEVLQLTHLEGFRKRRAGELSGGWKQRLAIANAFLHQPKILFLDEPTAGLDPVSRRDLWEMLYQLADQGVALFVTTHYMEEAERCHQLAFISQGSLLRLGEPTTLRKSIPGKAFEIECQPLMKASRLFHAVPGVSSVTAYGTHLHVIVQEEKVIEALSKIAEEQQIKIFSMKSISASLEDVFATLTEAAYEKN